VHTVGSYASVAIALPPSPALQGARVHLQDVFLTPQVAGGIDATHGLMVVLP
jgi:hypothetical protein